MNSRPNTSRYAILGMLSLGPQSGYDIKKLIDRSVAHFWNESFGQIYPILRRLEAEGLAVRRSQRRDGKPDSRVYSLTPKGLDELRRWLGAPARQEGFRSELLLKLFLGGRVSPAESVRQVRHFQAQQRDLLATYTGIERQLRKDHGRHPDLPYWLSTLHYGRRRAAALLGWADETLRTLGRLRRRRQGRSWSH